MAVLLTGYRFSVYSRAALLTLHQKDVTFLWRELDPFREPSSHPFGRVPVLAHDGFVLTETSAILRYVDAAFPGPALLPAGAQAQARMAQVMGIADAHAYWPLVRQVFAHRIFRPFEGEAGDEAQVAAGLAAAAPVLAVLEKIAREGLVLNGTVTLADLHLAPMIAAFAEAPEGARLLDAHTALARWWSALPRDMRRPGTEPMP